MWTLEPVEYSTVVREHAHAGRGDATLRSERFWVGTYAGPYHTTNQTLGSPVIRVDHR
jgi:hypothetical protein